MYIFYNRVSLFLAIGLESLVSKGGATNLMLGGGRHCIEQTLTKH